MDRPDDRQVQRLNANLDVPVGIETRTLAWQASPSRHVWRKRLYLDGPAESGKVTSLVRYEPGARFHAHDHPQGEEILVLEGVFSDEHGDWPAGSYLLNPEGFRHAPFSRNGCLLFVRLRQYAGTDRRHVAVNTHELPWETDEDGGIQRKALYSQPGYQDAACIERWPAGFPMTRSYPHGAELFIISGTIDYAGRQLGPLSWVRMPASAQLSLICESACEVFIRSDLP